MLTRADLRTAIRQAADMANSTFVSDVELNRMIDISTRSLYGILVKAFGEEYWAQVCWFNTEHPLSINERVQWPNMAVRIDSLGLQGALVLSSLATPSSGRNSSFVLPPQIGKLLRVSFCSGTVTQGQSVIAGNPVTTHEWIVNTQDESMSPMERIDSTGQDIPLKPYSWTEYPPRYRLRRGPVRFISGTPAAGTEWILDRQIIDILPVPSQNYAVNLTYVPEAMVLDNDVNLFYYPSIDYVIHDCAAQCLEKQQSDSSVQRALQTAEENRIRANQTPRDAANPPMVSMHGPYHQQYGRSRRALPWLR